MNNPCEWMQPEAICAFPDDWVAVVDGRFAATINGLPTGRYLLSVDGDEDTLRLHNSDEEAKVAFEGLLRTGAVEFLSKPQPILEIRSRL